MNQPAYFESELAPYFTTKAPFQFPADFRDGFVKYWPYVALVFMLISISVLVPLLGFLSIIGFGSIGILLSIASIVLGLLSLQGLFNQKRQGWVFSYYAQLVGILSGVLSLSVLGIIFGLLFLMLLFQVRERYN